MRIETALDPNIAPRKLLATKAQILTELEYVREGSEHWNALVWPLRMFETVLARASIHPTNSSTNSFLELDDGGVPMAQGNDARISQSQPSKQNHNLLGDAFVHDVDFSEATTEDAFGILPLSDNYEWLDHLFLDREDNIEALTMSTSDHGGAAI